MSAAITIQVSWDSLAHYYLQRLDSDLPTRLCDRLSELPKAKEDEVWYSPCFRCVETMDRLVEGER